MKIFSRLTSLVSGELRKGLTPLEIARTLAIAVVLGLFPLLGFTTLLCGIFGALWKLNHALLQSLNYLLAPLQLLLLPVWLHLGAWIFQVEAVTVSPLRVVEEFQASPLQFLQDYGLAGAQAVLAWTLLAVPAYQVLRRILEWVVVRSMVKGKARTSHD
jgi:uncharacterized protein (DUF2062 family)